MRAWAKQEVIHERDVHGQMKGVGWLGTLHNETFVGVGTRSVREGLVDLGSAERASSGLDLGGVWKSDTHLANEVFEARANVPIPLGRGFVEGDTPCDGVTTDQLLGHFAFRRQIEFGPHDDDWCGLMEGEGGSDRERAGGEGEEMMRWNQVTENNV